VGCDSRPFRCIHESFRAGSPAGRGVNLNPMHEKVIIQATVVLRRYNEEGRRLKEGGGGGGGSRDIHRMKPRSGIKNGEKGASRV